MILSKKLIATTLIGTATVIGLAGTAFAATAPTNATRLTNLQTRGNAEIARRLTSLAKLQTVISGDTKLATSDKSMLATEVSSETTGLTGLQTKLAADTDVATARTDVESIYTEYRVYALVTPKIYLVRASDDQQVAETKLTALATKLQTRITADQTAGKNVTSLQASLSDLNAKVAAAQSISTTIGPKVINLQPSDYNSDHAILSGDSAQLKTAHADNQAAYADAKTIVAGLKTLG